MSLISIGIVCYLSLRSLYRLTSIPLSNFPGSKRAVLTHLYDFHFDVIKDGRFVWEIEKMQ